MHKGDKTNLFGNSIPLIFNLENNLDTITYNIIKKIIFFFLRLYYGLQINIETVIL
jgi:hypothetical protein